MPPHTRSSPRPGPPCKKSTSAGASFGYLTAWAGTSWSLQKVPAPAGAQAGLLASVSCPSAASCVAVGNYLNSSGHRVVLAETWNGTAWVIRPAAVPPGASCSYLNGVSCLSPGSCTAVGNYQSGRHAHLMLAERWNGTSWAIQATPNPNALRAGLSAVSWLSASFCTAVGTQTSRWQNQTPLAQAWNGTARSIQQTPAPASPTLSLLSGVACPTATDCFSAGQGGGNAGSAGADPALERLLVVHPADTGHPRL